MKKILLAGVALLMLLTAMVMPLTASADESSEESDVSAGPTTAPTTASRNLEPNKVNVCVGAAAAKQGDLVEVPVTVETNPGVWALTLNVHYDMNVLVLQTVKFSDDFKSVMSVLDIDNVNSNSDQKNFDSPFVLYTEGNSLTSNVTRTGLFATLTFLVIPGAELGDTEISISYKPNNVIDVDGNNVLVATHKGFVSVAKGKPSEPGVTYFPSRTRKEVTPPANNGNNSFGGGLGGSTIIWIIAGAVLVVGVVLAILVVSKPADDNAKPTATDAGKSEAVTPKAESKQADKNASTADDGIDDQA